MVEWIKSLLIDYGTINVIIMFLTILLTNIIKKPIVNHAEKFVSTAKQLTGLDVDKSVITSNIIYIPVGVALVLYFLYTVVMSNFNFALIDWAKLVSDSVVYGMLSMSIYEIGKAKIKAYVSKNVYKDAKAQIQEKKTANEKDLLLPETVEDVDKIEEGIAEASTDIIKEVK